MTYVERYPVSRVPASPRYECAGMLGDDPLAIARVALRYRRGKPVLVSERFLTDHGNPYCVAWRWIDRADLNRDRSHDRDDGMGAHAD